MCLEDKGNKHRRSDLDTTFLFLNLAFSCVSSIVFAIFFLAFPVGVAIFAARRGQRGWATATIAAIFFGVGPFVAIAAWWFSKNSPLELTTAPIEPALKASIERQAKTLDITQSAPIEPREQSELNTPHNLSCPICNHQDKVGKVEAVHYAGIRGSTQYIPDSYDKEGNLIRGGTETTVEQSDLSIMLAPPAMPQATGPVGIIQITGLFSILGGLGWCLLLACPLLFIPSWVTDTSNLATDLIRSIPGLIIILLIMLLPAITLVSIGIAIISSARRDAKRRKDKVQAELILPWERAMKRWKISYYCARDNVVFDPNTREWASIQELQKYLYQ